MKTIEISWRRYILPNIHQEGWKFVGIFAAITALLAMIWEPLGWLGIISTIWCFYFFRDPERITPSINNVVVSPADGIVQMITKVKAPEELGMGDEKFTRVSVFMSVFNVHVNRMPVSGKIHKIHYRPGKFLNVADKDSEDNEREEYSVVMADGIKIGFVQIAGLVAKRIVSFVKEGDELQAGDRFGLIRFGSRLDVFLPKGIEPKVALGQISVAGETILADLKGSQKALEYEEK